MIVDFIPNHTGKKHDWFNKSVAKEAGYENYYIWADGKNPDPATNPPNDWVSLTPLSVLALKSWK